MAHVLSVRLSAEEMAAVDATAAAAGLNRNQWGRRLILHSVRRRSNRVDWTPHFRRRRTAARLSDAFRGDER